MSEDSDQEFEAQASAPEMFEMVDNFRIMESRKNDLIGQCDVISKELSKDHHELAVNRAVNNLKIKDFE